MWNTCRGRAVGRRRDARRAAGHRRSAANALVVAELESARFHVALDRHCRLSFFLGRFPRPQTGERRRAAVLITPPRDSAEDAGGAPAPRRPSGAPRGARGRKPGRLPPRAPAPRPRSAPRPGGQPGCDASAPCLGDLTRGGHDVSQVVERSSHLVVLLPVRPLEDRESVFVERPPREDGLVPWRPPSSRTPSSQARISRAEPSVRSAATRADVAGLDAKTRFESALYEPAVERRLQRVRGALGLEPCGGRDLVERGGERRRATGSTLRAQPGQGPARRLPFSGGLRTKTRWFDRLLRTRRLGTSDRFSFSVENGIRTEC